MSLQQAHGLLSVHQLFLLQTTVVGRVERGRRGEEREEGGEGGSGKDEVEGRRRRWS